MGVREVIKNQLVRQCERRYEKALAARTGTYKQWLKADQAQCGEAVSPAGGERMPEVVLVSLAKGTVTDNGLAQMQRLLADHPDVVLVYGDEDVQIDAGCMMPWWKPQWSPDTFLNSFYWGSLVGVRKSWLEQECPEQARERMTEALRGDEEITGEGMEAIRAKRMEALGKLAEAAGGYKQGCQRIGHIPHIIFHGESEKQQQALARRSAAGVLSGAGGALDAAAVGSGELARAKEKSAHLAGTVSVIIPSKDNPVILKQGLEALFRTAGACLREVLVVDNGSEEANRRAIQEYLAQVPVPCTYIYEPMEFNFSRMCNLGAERAAGELLLFLNDDVEACCEGWLTGMARKAAQEYVGAVGLKLYYPDSRRIQHAGIVNLASGPSHILQFLEDDRDYYYGYNRADRNVLAVTGACLMVQKKKYFQVAGMQEAFRVTYNDVDLCLKLWEQGYQNVVLNSTYAYHHESLSRGTDGDGEKRQRLLAEREKLYQQHDILKKADPYYPEGLDREGVDTAIRPAWLTAGNAMQTMSFTERSVDMQKYRRDDCLLICLEQCSADQIKGYGVVLGDNNACYRKTLLLWRQGPSEPRQKQPQQKPSELQQKSSGPQQSSGSQQESSGLPQQSSGSQQESSGLPQQSSGTQQLWKEPEGQISCHCLILEGQYRPDLEENMPDQKNVGLCGFWVGKREQTLELAPGVYRVGLLAEDRTGGTRLINWSGQMLKIS